MRSALELRLLGGVATRAELLARLPRSDLDGSVRAGEVMRDARGRYALPMAEEAIRLAHRTGGLLCLSSAALHHGWAVQVVPDRPHVLFPRNRRLDPAVRRLVHAHRGEVPRPRPRLATDRATTLAMCLRSLPLTEALAVADSALRDGEEATLRSLVHARGPGSRQVRRVIAEASALAANPFESALRGIGLGVPGLRLRPQVELRGAGLRARADLVDEDLRLVCEADSFAWHGGRRALADDAARYNAMVVNGWTVLRFSWEQVMHHPAEVRETLSLAVRRTERAAATTR